MKKFTQFMNYWLALFVITLTVSMSATAQNTPATGLDLDGANDHVSLPLGIAAGLEDFTFESWFK
jgi:hypothetical protein